MFRTNRIFNSVADKISDADRGELRFREKRLYWIEIMVVLALVSIVSTIYFFW